MALDLHFQEQIAESTFNECRSSPLQKWKTFDEDNRASGFDCNICLDVVKDPVVTFCGHLYCWPCIYKWIQFQSASDHQKPQCPVCKAEVSQKELIPLYGPGQATEPSEDDVTSKGMVIPQRPRCTLMATTNSLPSQQLNHRQQPHSGVYIASPPVIGEVVYARVFGNACPNSYNLAGNTSLRMRRQLLHADRSLGRLYFFLFCCVLALAIKKHEMALDLHLQQANRTSLKMFDDEREGGHLSRGFECSICLDLANDPVVTLCGHLYCWPCIYKWIHLHSIPSENPSQRHPQCPVCKADVSERSMVPLYGRDQATKTSEDEVQVQANGMVIPERPGIHTIDSHPPQQLHHRESNTTNMLHPMIGETARVSGNSSPTLYPYPNAHHLAGSTSLRIRRQQLQADDKSLRRVHFFLFCCVVLCLILL